MVDIKSDIGGKYELPLAAPEKDGKSVENIPQPEVETQKIEENKIQKSVKKIPVVSDKITYNESVNSTTQAIENILAEDLKDIYTKLPKSKQIEFKEKGEETANQIATLLNQIKYKVGEILGLIKSWLKIIPGISKFFLEQEAKIKTDKIIKYHQNKK